MVNSFSVFAKTTAMVFVKLNVGTFKERVGLDLRYLVVGNNI